MLTRQPQFNALVAHKWRSRGLRSAYLPISITPPDSSGNGRHATDNTGTMSVTHDGPGRAWTSAGATAATSYVKLPAQSVKGAGGVTWLAVVYASSVTDCTIMHTDFNTGGGGCALRVSGGVLEFIYPGVAVLAQGPTLTTNRWYTVAASFNSGNGSSGCACTWAVDGVVSAGTGLDNTALNAGDDGLDPAIGAQAPSSRLWSGRIALFANFSRLLPDADLMELTRNPWQLFVDPAESRMRAIRGAYVAAGGGGTFQNLVGRPFSLAGVHGLAGD